MICSGYEGLLVIASGTIFCAFIGWFLRDVYQTTLEAHKTYEEEMKRFEDMKTKIIIRQIIREVLQEKPDATYNSIVRDIANSDKNKEK